MSSTDHVDFTVKHKLIKGEQRPFILSREPLPEFKATKSGIHYAPLRPKYRDILHKDGAVPEDKLPDYTQGYTWPCPPRISPYIHQKITTEFMIQHPRNWILNKMRSGKTLSTIWAIHRMLTMGIIKKILIAAPLSIMRSVWQQELFMVMPNRSVYIADESVEDLYNILTYSDTEIVVINHDKLRHIDETLDQWGFDLMVVDEAGGFRAVQSDRVDALHYILVDTHKTFHRKDRRFIALTATPVPQSPLDIWRLGKIINPQVMPRTLTEYRDRVMHTIRTKTKSGKKILIAKPKKGVESYIQSLIKPAIKFKTEDCIDMPKMGYVTRAVHYSPPQKRALRAMENDHVTLIKDLNSGIVDEITAANAAVALSKYLQICGGVVLDAGGQPKIVGAKQRCDAIISIADELGPTEKIILFCMFTNVQNYISDTLHKHGIESLMLRGDMTGKERQRAVRNFQEDDEHRVIIIHPEVGKYGLNLSRANTTIWYTPVFSCDQYVQGNARMQAPLDKTRPEEDQYTTVVRLSGGDREDQLYARLLDREARQDRITEVFRRLITDEELIQNE